jgi:hypothetical protein
MLIALITLLFLGGGGSSAVMANITDYTDALKEILEGDDRRDAALETMASLKDLGKQQSKARKDVFKQIEKVVADHTTSPDVIGDLWSGYYQEVREINDAAVDCRFELREQLTREEWNRVFGKPAADG